ncbi:MAG: hypothetical protein R2730_10395 [Chitinophagales bacterium]
MAITSCKSLLPDQKVDLIKAIPNNVSFIVKTNDIQQLDSTVTNLPYANVLEQHSWLQTLKSNHLALSSILTKVAQTDSNQTFPMVASLHLANASSLNSIHYYPLNISKKTFNKLLDDNFSSSAKQQWQYQNATITELLIPELASKITLAFEDNILIASPISFLVEDAVKQLNNGNGLTTDESFQKVFNKQSNTADVNIWFKFATMSRWISTFADTKGTELLAKNKDFAEWMLLDLYFNEDGIFLSGITSTKGSNSLADFSEKSKCNHANEMILPVNTAVASHYSQIPDSLKSMANTANLKSCWTKALIEPLSKDKVADWVLVFKTKENSTTTKDSEAALENLGKRILKKEKVSVKAFKEFQLIAANASTLQNYYNSLNSNQVLSNDEIYMALQENLKMDANVNFYARSIYAKEAFHSIYKSENDFVGDFELLRGFNQVAFQFSKEGDKYLTNAHFTFSEHDISGHTNNVWKTNLEKDVMAGPQILTINKNGDKGVLVQDEDFKLYLLGQNGEVIWNKQLNSKWLGEAHSLKLYNDDAVQISFNTQLNWFLVDEDANDIVGFPLKFKDDANTGLNISKINGKECAFIGFSNDNIYGYEINGKPLRGWNPQNKVGQIIGNIQSVQYNGNVYITALNEEGKLFIWDEKGKLVKSTGFNTKFPSQPFIDDKAKPFKLKNVKSDGELVSFNPKGNVGTYKLPVSSVAQFMMANISGNSEPEIIVSNGTRITVFSYTGTQLWTKNTKGTMQLIQQNGNSKAVLSVIDQNDHTITLFDEKGSVLSQPDFYVGEKNCTGNLLGNDQMALVSNGQGSEVICYRIGLE